MKPFDRLRETGSHLFKARGKDKEVPKASTSEKTPDLRFVVSAKSGNPLFDALPRVLAEAPAGTTAQVIFAVDVEELNKDEKAKTTIRAIMDEAERRRRLEDGMPTEEDLSKVELDIRVNSGTNKLTVFIEDPQNKGFYWYRRFQVETGNVEEEDGEKIPYVDMEQFSIPKLEARPVPERALDDIIKIVTKEEKQILEHKDPEIRDVYASVGVARYNGEGIVSLNAVLRLVAVKFSQLITPSTS